MNDEGSRRKGDSVRRMQAEGRREQKEEHPIEYLRHCPETINPAIVTARHIQHLELSGQVTPEMMEQLAKEAKAAIAQGKQAISDYNHSLEKLKLANSQPNQLPWGF